MAEALKPIDLSRTPLADALRVMMPAKPPGTIIRLSLGDAMASADELRIMRARHATPDAANKEYIKQMAKRGNPIAGLIQGAQVA